MDRHLSDSELKNKDFLPRCVLYEVAAVTLQVRDTATGSAALVRDAGLALAALVDDGEGEGKDNASTHSQSCRCGFSGRQHKGFAGRKNALQKSLH